MDLFRLQTLRLECYGFKTINHSSANLHLIQWSIGVSNDGAHWKGTGAKSTHNLTGLQKNLFLGISDLREFWLRIRPTGKNATGSYYFVPTGLELCELLGYMNKCKLHNKGPSYQIAKIQVLRSMASEKAVIGANRSEKIDSDVQTYPEMVFQDEILGIFRVFVASSIPSKERKKGRVGFEPTSPVFGGPALCH